MRDVGFVCILCLFLTGSAFAQTCTLTATGTLVWSDGSLLTCQEGGNAGDASVLVIPAGLTVVFDSNGDTWTGVRIDVLGTLRVTNPSGATINASIAVKSTGFIDIQSRLYLGSSPDCGYTIGVESGGSIDIEGNASDRLYICDNNIAQAGGGCNNNYPTGSPPYCVPNGGFQGPTGFDQGGHNGTLPVTWLSFKVQNIDNKSVFLTWATATEINSDSFIVERSADGKVFHPIGSRPAAGSSNDRKDYSFADESPFIGKTYYRLKQADLDGMTSYSDIRSIELSGKKTVSVFPNPVTDDAFGIRLNFSEEDIAHATIYDVSGFELNSFAFPGNEFSAPLRLNAGSYLLKVRSGKENLVCRFIVR